MRLNMPADEFKAALSTFSERIKKLMLPGFPDQKALTTQEEVLKALYQEIDAYFNSSCSEDLTRYFVNGMWPNNRYNIPGKTSLDQAFRGFNNALREKAGTLLFIIEIINLSDPLLEGKSYEDERFSMQIIDKRHFLLKKLYELRIKDRHYDANIIFGFNEVNLQPANEYNQICKALQKEGLIDVIFTRDAASCIITAAGKQYVESHLLDQHDKPTAAKENLIDIFISHTTADDEIAELLVDLLKTAFNLPGKRIRCSSLDGYRLSAGASIDEQLRAEVYDCRVLVGLISERSLRSAYVLFELGARWGAGKPLIPIYIDQKAAALVEGPLRGKLTLEAFREGQVLQLLGDVAQALDMEMEAPKLLIKKVKMLCAACVVVRSS